MLGRLVRYFGQSPDYWLDTCTLHDWRTIWNRELVDAPPVDEFVRAYFKYEPPADLSPATSEAEEWICPLPEMTE